MDKNLEKLANRLLEELKEAVWSAVDYDAAYNYACNNAVSQYEDRLELVFDDEKCAYIDLENGVLVARYIGGIGDKFVLPVPKDRIEVLREVVQEIFSE